MEQAVGVHRVGALRLVQPEDQAFLGGDRLGPVDHLAPGLGPAAVLAAEHVGHGLGGLAGCARVELEGVPDDLDVVGVLELGQGLLEAALADVAPRADHVGPDVDAHVVETRRPPGVVPPGGRV